MTTRSQPPRCHCLASPGPRPHRQPSTVAFSHSRFRSTRPRLRRERWWSRSSCPFRRHSARHPMSRSSWCPSHRIERHDPKSHMALHQELERDRIRPLEPPPIVNPLVSDFQHSRLKRTGECTCITLQGPGSAGLPARCSD